MIDLKHGDCLQIMKTMPNDSIDAIITDPPYGTTACKWDAAIPFEPMWEELKRVVKNNGVIVLFGSQPFTSALVMSNPKMFKYQWIWEKSKASGYLNSKKRPMVSHEDIAIFCKSTPIYYPQMTKGDPYNKGTALRNTNVYGNQKITTVKNDEGLRYPRSVQYFKTAESEGKVYHPTQKPLILMEYLVKTYTQENNTVLDFTMGSGTTGVACKNLNRNFIGIESDERYFKIAQERIDVQN
jgi:site-specific DNA-methyltransferase (adenine-specific)